MNTKALRSLFTLFCALLVAATAHAAVIYNHDFNNRNFNAHTSINANMTAAWTSTGATLYSRDYSGNPGMALNGYNHVYILTITMKEGYQAEFTSISFSRLSGDNATFQVQVNGENYGSSITSSSTLQLITRTKTVSELRNTIKIRLVVSNSSSSNGYYSAIDNFTVNGSVSSYDPAAEAKPDANGILYVDGDISTPGDGSSWDHALKRMYYATQAAAINPAIQQVWVAEGTYGTKAANTPFSLTNGVAYYGGFSGYESDLRERSVTSSPVTLQGLGGNVITATGAGASTRLDGFFITAGTGFSSGGARLGGAIYLNNSSPTIANCIFNGNNTDPAAADGKGGAIYLLNSNPLVLQCLFILNTAKGTTSGQGGAIYIDGSSPTIRNCTFSKNEVGANSAPGNGGAIYIAGRSSPVIENNIIWDNADPASPDGKSSISGSGTPTVAYSLIQGGFAGGTSILDTDPQFTNAAELDFRQVKGSPVTNAGNPATDLSAFPKTGDDSPITLDGERRLTSSAIDLGPYEVAPSTIWYVNAASTAPVPSGESWASAFTRINDALSVATSGDQIWIARGLYDDEGSSLAMIHGVKIYGSFVGNETAVNQRPLPIVHGEPATATVFLSFNGPAFDNYQNNLTRDDLLDGLTITGALGTEGGAIRNVDASPTIANCAFIDNSAFDGGGGVYNYNSSPLIINTLFKSNNVMFGSGGAINNKSGSNTILINCVIVENSASEFSGAIFNDGSTITLLNCTVSGNSQSVPGTINGYYGNVTVRNSIIYGNGSGISNNDGTVTVTYSLVEGMTASDTDHNLDGGTNPQFTSPTDWTLLACSPAINRGTNDALPGIPNPSTDLVNNLRIYNVQTDMGAYEMQAIPGPGTLPASGETVALPVYAGATSLTSDCKTFGLIEPTGAPGTLGNVTIKAFLAAGNTVADGEKIFVKRHYDITPSGTDGPAKVTLFFAKADFDAYNQAYGNANNATLPANLKVMQYHGTSPYGFPGTYSGKTELITDVTVTESADQTMYLVSFNASGFSGFFISGQSEEALPVTLVSFQAKKQENTAYLQWKTSSEINSRSFEIERSSNGKQWHRLGEVLARGSESALTDYSYTDSSPMAGTNMYRLKMIDRAADRLDGSFAYSRMVSLDFGAESAALYPNPAVGVSKVSLKGLKTEDIRHIRLFNMSGKAVSEPVLRQGSFHIGQIGAGNYTVEVQMSDGTKRPLKLIVTH
jgi:hypothetical protein